MKILITTMRNDYDKKIVSTQFLSETENIKHELIELEPLPEKEGYTQEVIYDKKSKSYKLHYVEIPKTETEKLREELKKTNKALQEFLLSQEEDEE
ncbi:MAG: hypothetical protein ACTTKQ_00445 [Filifactor alocis]|uniref:hypothetical protein n=1 Tax=Filifactor alocis TaxID=143361 RepID=UPI003FA0B624